MCIEIVSLLSCFEKIAHMSVVLACYAGNLLEDGLLAN